MRKIKNEKYSSAVFYLSSYAVSGRREKPSSILQLWLV